MSDTDVIELLRHIDPAPGEQAPAPIAALLERLDGPPRPPARGRRRRRPELPAPAWRGRRLVLGCAGAATVALAAVVLLSLPGGGTPNVAAAMYQATTPGSGVLHMNTVTEKIVGGHTQTTSEQFWSEQNPRRVRLIISNGEETLESALTTQPLKLLQWSQSNPDVIKQSVPTGIADSEQTGVQVLRQLYRKGELTLAGKSTFDGQPAWLLEVHPQYTRPTVDGKQLPNPTVVVSASSFVPLEFDEDSVSSEHGTPELMVIRVRYVEYEELPRNTQDEALLALAEHQGASIENEG